MTAPFDLSGQRVFITGAAGGIGSATARLCAAHGASLILADVAPSDATKSKLGGIGGTDIHQLDSSDRAAVEALAARIGPIDSLVDTAAICPFDDWTTPGWDETLDRVLAVNIKGPINLTRAFLPAMQARRRGRIVLCGSIAGHMGGVRSGAHYAFSKGGLHAFVRWLARRAAEHNVLVNAVAPGPVDTGMTSGQGYQPDAFPLRRMASPDEIASCIAYLCGPGASYATGAIFDVNGGTHFH